jgi:hypothetical protein
LTRKPRKRALKIIRRLTDKQIVAIAIDIIGKDEGGKIDKAAAGDIYGALFSLKEEGAALARIRARGSRGSTALKQLDAALRKAIIKLPEFSFVLASTIFNVSHYASLKYPHNQPDAFERHAAARAAVSLCQRFEITPTSTRGGKLCRLAAVLYGDVDADLQYHCIKALKDRLA